ncbi:transient receptor potential cation channel subfamily M member 7 isoform X2 [Nematostella vectensis]|uniref:transient receptor potential cation channel subfamily M member 7 isoform X2 n=1 Tax=Nematostella vectensis TaxID=45351 RepID=UPI0020771946|nr:transient receptor potential cation channel subfamily M member 7 isoform X2 [Nematostella vectensis]
MHTRLEPTDAYGQLEFSGAGQKSRAKYIRVEHETDPRDLLTLLTKQWGLSLPKLLISVTGGAKSFVLHPKLKQVLRQGLLKAARTTGAWILTGGTNTGVMKHVGEAVRGQMLTSHLNKYQQNQLYLIGIATWGIVDHKETLQEKKDTVTYHMTSSMTSAGACLDNNHSHFILVDDGTEGKYGGEIALRASLENCISKQRISQKSQVVPVVLLVLEGGMNTIRTVLESVTRSPAVPVVIAEGSGRAADILSYAQRFIVQDKSSEVEMTDLVDIVEHRKLLMKIETAFPEADDDKKLELYREVLQCVCNKQYITIFRVDEEGVDIDRAILRALLKAQHASAADQLSLALVWNRVDIAKSEIFVEGQKWEVEDLNSAMMDALLNNRVEFVKLLLENGVSMGQFLTPERLLALYRGRAKSSYSFQQMIGEDKIRNGFSLEDVNNLIGRMLGGVYTGCSGQTSSLMTGLDVTSHLGMFINERPKFMAEHCDYPFNELLIWAVLCKMQKMALFLWERGEHALAKALLASRIYMEMAERISHDEMKTDVLAKVECNVSEFKQVALDLLNECFHANERAAQKLLTYHLDIYCGHTCLTLAVATEHKEFVAHTCCQGLLTEIWMGAMRSANMRSMKILLGILVPPFIFNVEFKTRKELSQLPVTIVEHMQELGADSESEEDEFASPWKRRQSKKSLSTFDRERLESTAPSRPTSPSSPRSDIDHETKSRRLGLGRRILEFYRAPITKFWANVIAYFMFLILFSFVVLVKQPSNPYISEIVLIVFVFTLCTEEIRQIFQSDSSASDNRFKAWASSKWNICDGVAVVLFFVGLGLRLNSSTFNAGHIIYCLDIMLWIIRLLDIFSVSQHLGPYVVMIGRMTVDMIYFLLIMVIFLLAYGVAQQAILFPNQPPSWAIISHIFFRPYFQIYGELFITDPIQLDNRTTAFSTPAFDAYSGTITTCILAFYILVANILLLNLLIAIFNNTFSDVQANSNQIWKFRRFELVMEYVERPVLVPPLIFFNHVIEMFVGISQMIRSARKGSKSRADHRLKLFLNKEELQKLMMFEEHCMYMFLHHKDTLFNATSEERVRLMGNRIESVISQLEELDKDSFTRDTTAAKTMSAMDSRLNRLEKNTKAILKMLSTLHDVSPEHYGAPRGDSSDEEGGPGDVSMSSSILSHFSRKQSAKSASGSTSAASDDQSPRQSKGARHFRGLPSVDEKEDIEDTFIPSPPKPTSQQSADHLISLSTSKPRFYPMSEVERFEVPDDHVDWKVAFPGYNPPHPDISSHPAEDVLLLRFNEIDGFVDRRSHMGTYDVINGLPRNPRGRTGFSGRGAFAHWGPNHTATFVITRLKLNPSDGHIVEENDQVVWEFLAVKEADETSWRLPEGEMKVTDYIPEQIIEDLLSLAKESILELSNGSLNLHETLQHLCETCGQRVKLYSGYVDDPRNTDNAWLETNVVHFHDEFREGLGRLHQRLPHDDSKSLTWMKLTHQANISAYHLNLLQKVSQQNDVFF